MTQASPVNNPNPKSSKIIAMTDEEYKLAKISDIESHDDLDDVDIYGDESTHWMYHEIDTVPLFNQEDVLFNKSDRNYVKTSRATSWPNKQLVYDITPGHFSSANRALIKSAMDELARVSCVTFKQKTTETVYLKVTGNEAGCYNLGNGYWQSRTQRMQLNLGRGCMYKGTIMHELLHALGFGHEQKRPDRNSYIKVNWNNIQTNNKPQFWRIAGPNGDANAPKCNYNRLSSNQDEGCVVPGSTSETYGISYDYGSIMHYGPSGFSRNGLPTMTAINGGDGSVMGNRKALSSKDIQKLNAAYQCSTNTGGGGGGVSTPAPTPPTTTLAPPGTSTNIILPSSIRNQVLRPGQCGVIRSHDSYPLGNYEFYDYRYWFINTSCRNLRITCQNVRIRDSSFCHAQLVFQSSYVHRSWCQYFGNIYVNMPADETLRISFSSSYDIDKGFQCEVCPNNCA